MVSPQLALSSFFLPFLLCSFCSKADAGSGTLDFHEVNVDGLLPAEICSSPTAAADSGKRSLTISHRYGPCSPLDDEKKSGLDDLLLQDLHRVSFLQQASDAAQIQASGTASLPAKRGSSLGTGNYVVTVGLGTPKKYQTVVFDTASTVSWVQSKPCAKFCHPQQDPLFDPSASTSYRNISCERAACGGLPIRGCSAGSCLYGVRYGDTSSSLGVLGQDVLTLAPGQVLSDFVFGCGQSNQGLFGRMAGIVGLSRDPLSLATQASYSYGTVFSYCLPVSKSATGDLTFGGAAKGTSIRYTPMLSTPSDPRLYAVGLTGISVGGQRLAVAPSAFSSGGGTIIDSGTVITRLPPSGYSALRAAFRSAMAPYKLGEPVGVLDTCYDMSGVQQNKTISVPTVALHFGGGVDLNLSVAGIFFVTDIRHFCLAFAGNRDAASVGIIGNIQQRTVEVVYDVGAKRIGFGTGICGR